MPTSLDVVIVNWKAGQSLSRCVAALLDSNATAFSFGRVVVVDNASGDGCAAALASQFPRVTVLENTMNRGFAAGCNAAARDSRSDYLLFLNPDLVLSRDALDKVISFFESSEARNVGICGIRLTGCDNAPAWCCWRFPTLRFMMLEMMGLDRLAPAIFRSRHMAPAELQHSREVDHVIGAFFAVRRRVFEHMGGFDETFFLYFEEVDFALRARQRKWASYFVAEAEAVHEGRVSSDQIKGSRLLYYVSSRLIYCRKHMTRTAFAVVLAFTVLIEPVARFFHAVAGGSLSDVRYVIEGYGKLTAAATCWAWQGLQRGIQLTVFSGDQA
jgi:GT2 family glycosyltransferase